MSGIAFALLNPGSRSQLRPPPLGQPSLTLIPKDMLNCNLCICTCRPYVEALERLAVVVDGLTAVTQPNSGMDRRLRAALAEVKKIDALFDPGDSIFND